jgi:phospholipid-translocating ATPase
MNQKAPKSKVSLLDTEVNFLSKLLFNLMIVLSFGITFLNNFKGDWMLFLFRIMLLLNSIIPISLRINLDLARLWFCYCINSDDGIKGAIARNSNIPEELGRV